ncbi:MAG TPA: hypothetical protein VKB19_10745 [Pedobacter sp.]|nr:hypothetical protein [Pedobacter sp.]
MTKSLQSPLLIASPNAPMVHMAININTDKGMVNWLESVTEEQ